MVCWLRKMSNCHLPVMFIRIWLERLPIGGNTKNEVFIKKYHKNEEFLCNTIE